MLVFPCKVCQTVLSATEAQAGTLVRCPTCLGTLRVPEASSKAQASSPLPPPRTGTMVPPGLRNLPSGGVGRRFGFNCGYCSSRLEATEAQCGQDGACPTCGNNITIPILDKYNRLIDPKSGQIIKPDPHPVHAYAAAGERAPKIVRTADEKQAIQCPRCRAVSPISANNCKACGMPFTMEGTTLEAAGSSNGFCTASLVLGVIGIPASCAILPPVLAIIFGIIGYSQMSKSGNESGGKGMAIGGIVCGAIGLFLAGLWYLR